MMTWRFSDVKVIFLAGTHGKVTILVSLSDGWVSNRIQFYLLTFAPPYIFYENNSHLLCSKGQQRPIQRNATVLK